MRALSFDGCRKLELGERDGLAHALNRGDMVRVEVYGLRELAGNEVKLYRRERQGLAP